MKMKILIFLAVLLLGILLGIIKISRAHEKNETFNRNNRNNGFITKEKVQQAVKLLVSLTEDMPVNEGAIILSNFMDSEDDVEDLIDSTIRSEPFLKIVGFFKVYTKKMDVLYEINEKFSNHPAMKLLAAAQKAAYEKYKLVQLLDLDEVTKAKLILNSKIFEGVIKLQNLAKKVMKEDTEFANFVEYIYEDFKVISEALTSLTDKIRRNKILQDVANHKSIKISQKLLENIYSTGHKYVKLMIFAKELDGILPSGFADKAYEEFNEAIQYCVSHLQNNENLLDFIAYIRSDEVKKLLKTAWQEASFEEEKDNSVKHEL